MGTYFNPNNESFRKDKKSEIYIDKTADTAIRQIKDRRYTGALSGYHDKILLVGICYDPDNKSHSCEIEEWENR